MSITKQLTNNKGKNKAPTITEENISPFMETSSSTAPPTVIMDINNPINSPHDRQI